MRIAVCVKWIIDPSVVRFNIETNSLEYIFHEMDSVDEAVLSEAISIKHRIDGVEVIAITLGPPIAEEVLRNCLKKGVDDAIHLYDQAFSNLDAYSTSIVLAKLLARLQCQLILCGNESSDEGNGFIGAGIAEWLDLPLVTAVTDLEILKDRNLAVAHRRVKGGSREVVQCSLPVVLAIDGVSRKRVYPRLCTVLAGLRKEITRIDAESLGIKPGSIEPRMAVKSLSEHKPRLKKGMTIDSNLPPAERIKLILSGGFQQKSANTIEKAPDESAAEIIQFLMDNRIIK